MPKPKENQIKKGTVGGKRMAKRGPSSVTKKKDRLKRSLDRESSQLTISQVEKPEKVDEEKMRKEREEREEARRIWLQQQRIKYPVAPDGFIPNSIVRSNLQPHVPHPPEKQPEEKTKQLTFLERRMSRLERMNSIDIQLQQQFGPSSEMRFTDSISQSSSTSLNAVDRDRPSSKKKQRGSDVVNDVVTQIRNTSPQLLTSLLELEDIAEVESRLESTPHGGNGGEQMEGRRDMEDKRGGEEDGGKKENKESRGRGGRDPPHDHPQKEGDSPHHHDHNHHSSVAKQQTLNDDHHQKPATIQHNQGNEGDSDSSDPNRRREYEGLEKIKELKEDGDGDVDAISAAAAADAREDVGKEERDVRVGGDGEDLEKYPPSSWKIPLIVEPGDDENDAEEEEQTTREGGDGEGDGRGGGGGGQVESEEADPTKGNDGAAVAEHDGNFGANHVTGSGSDGASHSDENEKPSQEVEIDNGEGGQQSNRGQRVDSRTENETEKEEEDDVVKVVNICLPFLRQLDEGDSAAGEATTNAANGEEQEADEDESGENSRRRRRRRRRRGIDGEEEWEALSPSYSSFALRPPRLHDDDLDLTSFNSSMAATNASPPTFIELDESQTGAKDDGEINFLDSRKDFPFAMGDYNDERDRNDDELLQLNGGDGQQHQQLRGDGGVDENDRFWSSCSNGRLNRRHQHRDSMDDALNPSPPLGWHLTWYDRHHQGQHHPHSGSSKVDRKGGGGGGDADGFLPRLLQLASSSKDDQRGRRHRCEYSILVQKRMHEHISISRYLRTKKLAEILCDFRRPINYNIIKFQYAV